MGLFGFGKKKAEQKPCSCTGQCDALIPQQDVIKPHTVDNNASLQSTSIKVLGTGCASCHSLFMNTKSAVSHMGLDISVEYVQDIADIASYGVMCMPALVVNNTVVSSGTVLKPAEVETKLKLMGF